MIPEEAIEAAAKAFRETHFMDDALMNALEAAAPHLMAAAWDEGYDAADYDAPHSVKTDNPYRK
jgi:hypothetical protein